MATLDDLFTTYLSAKPPSVQPYPAAVERAKKAHTELRDDLEKDATYGPFVARTMLSGSYGRDTAIQHIKDVDIIIETTFTKAYLEANKRGDESAQQYLLRLTQDAIRRTGRATRTRQARRSIHIKLPPDELGNDVPELTLDIVPVLIQARAGQDPLTIADRDLKQWYDTYPNTQLADSESRNRRSKVICDRHSYKPLVKLFKAWKKVHFRSAKTPKGFVLECLTAQYHNPYAAHWAEAVRDLFQNICEVWPNPDLITEIPDVADISNDSGACIPIAKTVEEAQGVIQKIHDHLALVEQAIAEAETDLYKAAKTLQRVFGSDPDSLYFPLPDDEGHGGSKSNSGNGGPSPYSSRSNVREAPPFGC